MKKIIISLLFTSFSSLGLAVSNAGEEDSPMTLRCESNYVVVADAHLVRKGYAQTIGQEVVVPRYMESSMSVPLEPYSKGYSGKMFLQNTGEKSEGINSFLKSFFVDRAVSLKLPSSETM